MRKLKIMEHISLDGVIQHSSDKDEFPYRDWTAPYRTLAGREEVLAAQGGSYDLPLGRRTYEIWWGSWPKAPSSPLADGINAAKKYVATHRPESLEWGPVESLGPDIVEGVRRIKSAEGPTLSLGVAPRSHRRCSNMGLRMKFCWSSIRCCWARGSASLRRNPGALIRARQHESNAFRHHLQFLQIRRPFEDRIDVAARHRQ
jgi:hypothetical protein